MDIKKIKRWRNISFLMTLPVAVIALGKTVLLGLASILLLPILVMTIENIYDFLALVIKLFIHPWTQIFTSTDPLNILITMMFIVGIVLGTYFHIKYKKLSKTINNSN